MRMWFTSLVALALVVAASCGPVAAQEPKAAANRTLRIRVVSWTTTDGKQDKIPVAGATVVVRPRDGVVDLAAGQTGADGIVLLAVPRQQRGYSLQATCAGFDMQCRELDAEWPDTHDYPAEITIDPAAALGLAGSVLDAATGRPIAGARVFQDDVNKSRGRPLAQTSTGAEGAFVFAARSPNGAFVYDGITTSGRSRDRGLVELAVVAPGYVLVSRVLQVTAGRGCEAGAFHLEPAGTIRGRVLHADGSPFADARIDVLGRAVRSPDGDLWHEMPGFAELETRSAADGTFTFPHAPFDLPLTVGASAYGRWVKTPGLLRRDEDHSLLDCVSGLVLTREKPVAEVVLRERGKDATHPADLVVEVTSGRTDVTARTIAGQLCRLGSDWPWTWNSSAQSETGPLTFARVPEGMLRLHVTTKDLPEEVVDVQVVPRNGPTRVEVVLGGTETLEGRVVDETGEPIAGATVRCRREHSSRSREVHASAQGEFRIEDLPRGRHVLLAAKNGFAAKRIVYVDAPARGVSLPLGPAPPQSPRSPSRGSRYPVPGGSAGAGVAGVVLGPDGQPSPFAAVYTETARECCDAEGRFSIAPAAVIYASTEQTSPRHAAGMLRLDAAQQGGDVVIQMAATRGVLVDTGRSASRSAWVEAEPRGNLREQRCWPDTTRFVTGHLDDRGIAFLRLLPGEWTLRFVALDEEQCDPTTRTQTVIASADVTVPAQVREPGAQWSEPSVRLLLHGK